MSDYTETPDVALRIAFDGSNWSDMSSYLREFSYGRGRDRPLERMRQGGARVALDNINGHLDSANDESPFYPNVRPGRPIQITALAVSGVNAFRVGRSANARHADMAGDAVPVNLFTGRTEGGPIAYGEAAADSWVEWDCIDESKRLNRDRSSTGFGSGNQLSGDRIDAVLDGATPIWDQSKRTVDAGARTVQAVTGDLGRYDYILQVAESEGGAFFIDGDGNAVFRDSTWNPAPMDVPFGIDPATSYLFEDISPLQDDQEIYNAVTVTAPSQTDVVVVDQESANEFGRSDLPISTILSGPTDMTSRANDVLSAYADPHRRIDTITLTDGNWFEMLRRNPMDRIVLHAHPRYHIGDHEHSWEIEGLSVSSPTRDLWKVVWSLAQPIDVIPGAINDNLLNDNQYSIETDTSGWQVYSNPGVALSQTSANPYVGTHSMFIQVQTDLGQYGWIRTTPYNVAAVVPGNTYRAAAQMINSSANGPLDCNVGIEWFDSGGNSLYLMFGDTVIVSSPTSFSQVTSTDDGEDHVAPGSAAFARVHILIQCSTPIFFAGYADAITLRAIQAPPSLGIFPDPPLRNAKALVRPGGPKKGPPILKTQVGRR